MARHARLAPTPPGRKLRVLVTRCWGLGGGQVWAHEFSNHVAGLGHDVRVVLLRSWWPGQRHPGRDPGQGRALYRTVDLRAPLFVECCCLAGFLGRHLREEPADVIVSTGAEAALVPLIRRRQTPAHLASFHSTYPDWIGLGELVARGLNITRRGIARTYAHWNQHLDRFSMMRADQVVCSSRHQASRLVNGLRVPSARVRTIYYGIDSERFCPGPSRQELSGQRILCAGGPWPSKGIDILLEAFADIHREFPQATVLVVGGGDWAPYERRVQALGLSARVRNHGPVPHEGMGELYRQAYLLAAPTRHESFGLVVAEAMACAVPVVATAVAAIPEVVEEGVTGLLVPGDDPGAFGRALAALLRDPGRAAEIGYAGRMRVEERFAWRKIIRQWEELLLELVQAGTT